VSSAGNELQGSQATLKTSTSQAGQTTQGESAASSASQSSSSAQPAPQALPAPTTPIEVPANQDANTNKQEVGQGQSQTVSLNDGDQASITISNDQLDEAKSSSSLKFISNNFQDDDVYQIYIPKGGIEVGSNDVAKLGSYLGTTTFTEDQNYYIITDRFTTTGSVKQTITLSLSSVPGLTEAGSYEKVINHGYVTKNGSKIGNFDIQAIGRPFTLEEDNGSTIENVWNKKSGVDLVTKLVPGTVNMMGSKDNLTHMTVVYNNLPDYYQPTKVDLKEGDRIIESIAVTSGMVSGKTLTIDIPVDSNSQLRSLLNARELQLILTGVYNVPDSAFANGVYNTTLQQPAVTLTDQNNYSLTQTAAPVNLKIFESTDNTQIGQLVGVNQSYEADYTNKTDDVPENTVDVDTTHKNGGSGFYATVTPISNRQATNVVISVQIPNGVNAHSVQLSSNNKGLADLDLSYGVQITYTDGTTALIKEIPNNGIIQGAANKSIRSLSVRFATYDYEDQLSFQLKQGSNFTLASSYANGNPVASGDLLVLKASVSADQAPVASFNTTYDRLTLFKSNKQGVLMASDSSQNSVDPGVVSAGSIGYEITDSGYGKPQLDQPIMYIEVPDNAILDPNKAIQVGEAGNAMPWGNGHTSLTPKSTTTLNINGHTFLKIDLSNYAHLENGFSVKVYYSNGIDYLTSVKHTPFLVVAKNGDQVESVNDNSNNAADHRPTSNNFEASDKDTFEALVSQEHIDVQKAMYHGSSETGLGYNAQWKINVAAGTVPATMTQGNTNTTSVSTSTQDISGNDPTHFTIFGSLINGDSDAKIEHATQVINLPSTEDGKSGFTPALTGPVSVTDPNTNTDLSNQVTVTYYTDRADLDQGANSLAGRTGLTADQVTDWSKIKAIKIVFNSEINKQLTARVTMKMIDNQIYDHVGKSIYASELVYSSGDDLRQIAIHPGDKSSAKLTVVGKSTVKTIVHYQDDNGTDHYVELSDKAVTYNDDGSATMKRTDFVTKDSDLTNSDHMLLPEHMVLDYDHPTIKNSNASYAAGYTNGTAAFDQTVAYDFDGDAVVFEGKVAQKVTGEHQVTRTVHYVYADGSKAHNDAVQTSKKFESTGYKNPFTGKVAWSETVATDTLPEVTSPTIDGYTPDKTSVAAVTVDSSTDDLVETVTYSPADETAKVEYIDDSDNCKVLETKSLAGKYGADSGYNTKKTIAKYENLGYDLVSDPTKGQNVVFTSSQDPIKVHLKFVGHAVIVKFIDDDTGEQIDSTYSSSGRVGAELSDDQLKVPVNEELAELTQNWYDSNGNKHKDGKYARYQLVSNGFTAFDGKIGNQDLNYVIHVKENVVQEKLDIPIALPPIVQVDPAYADQLAQAYTDGTYSDTSNADHQTLVDHAHLIYGTLVPNADGKVDTLSPHNTNGGSIQFNLDGTPYTYEGEDADSLMGSIQGLQKANHLDATITFDLNIAKNYNGDENQGVSNLKIAFGDYHGFDTKGYHDLKMLVQDPQSGQYKWISLNDPTVLQAEMSAEDYVKSVIDQSNGSSGLTIDGIQVTPSSSSIYVYYSPNYESGYSSMIPATTIATKQYEQYQQDYTTAYMPQNSSYVITYITMTPDTEQATIEYIDDTTGQTLATEQTSGDYNSVINFPTKPTDKISAYEGQGYELVSNDFTDGTKYGLKNNFEVHLKHGTHVDYDFKTVTETIHYKYDNGTTAKPDKVQSFTFSRSKTTDLVTKKSKWSAWSENGRHTFAEVISPTIDGYTPDYSSIESVTVDPDSQNIEKTVIYTADKQNAKITYIDDTTGQILNTDTATGKSGDEISFNIDPATRINNYKSQGYILVSNSFTAGAKYDSDNAKNVFVVHLKHGTKSATQDVTIKQTIHYIYADGTKAADDNVQSVKFTRTGTTDLVTGKTTWNPTSPQKFKDVTSPTINGYTADQTSVKGATVNAGDADVVKTVIYTPNGSTQPTQPTTAPSEPSNPTQPTTAPSEPSNPTQPTTAPSEPSSPTQPTTAPSEPSNPTQPTTPATHDESGHPTKEIISSGNHDSVSGKRTTTGSSAKQTQQNKLPQTGNDRSEAAIGGLMLVGLTSMFGLAKRKKRD
jgi:LPXTG-motif cell wall-anchored protein